MRKPLALLAVLVLFFTACGREGGPLEHLAVERDARATPTPAPQTDEVVEEAPEETEEAVEEAPAAPAPEAPQEAQQPPPPPPDEGHVNRPRPGTYVYAYSGSQSNPFNPAAGQQPFQGELRNDISHEGDTYTTVTTNSESPGRTTVVSRYHPDRVEMLSVNTETPAGNFNCRFDPPLVVTRYPIQPQTYPTQQIRGSGNMCDGTLDITIVRKTTAEDGTGRAWDTWEARIRLVMRSAQVSFTSNETRWASPDLGVEIRSESQTEGQFGAQRVTGQATSVLQRYP